MDDNRVPELLCERIDNREAKKVQINPGTGKVLMDYANNSRTITKATTVPRDDNRVPVGLAERTDNGEVMPIHVTPEGRLLIEIS